MTRKLSDHLIMITITLVATIVYFGYEKLTQQPEDEHAGHDHSAMAQQAPAIDVQGFIDNLPTEFEPLVSMGNGLMDQSHFDLAIECYSRALKINPEDVNVRVDLGACQHAVGRADEAIANFMQSLEYQPLHLTAKFNLGIVYFSTGDTTQAVEWWQKLLSENPPKELKSRAEHLLMQVMNDS